jgi:hypothetical protein
MNYIYETSRELLAASDARSLLKMNLQVVIISTLGLATGTVLVAKHETFSRRATVPFYDRLNSEVMFCAGYCRRLPSEPNETFLAMSTEWWSRKWL